MGRTSDIIRFRVKESEVQMWVFPRVPWQVLFFFFTEQDGNSGHLTPCSGFPPGIPPFWVPGQDGGRGVGMEMEAAGYG